MVEREANNRKGHSLLSSRYMIEFWTSQPKDFLALEYAREHPKEL